MNKFEELYLQIINEQKCPVTFTPEPLLDYIREKCYFSNGEKLSFTINQLLQYCDDVNKPLFSQLVKNLKHTNDYAMLIIYFNNIKDLDDICLNYGYQNPPQLNKPNFSLKEVHKQIKQFFLNPNATGCNFNSIDTNPQLGCVIGLNGKNIKSIRDFEKVLDHQLNHYFQKMNIKFNKADNIDNVVDFKSKKIIDKINEFYGLNLQYKPSFYNDIKYHLFDYNQFRSMCADVFHQIIRYNQNHTKELNYNEFINDIKNCNYKNYDIKLQDYILFGWICLQINEERWITLVTGVREAFKVKRNIFEKFFIRGKDIFRNLILKLKNNE